MKVRIFTLAVLSALLLALPACTAQDQSDEEIKAIREEIERLKKDQKEILKALDEIKGLLRGKPAAPPTADIGDITLTLEGRPVTGEKTAKLTLMEFSDYQCPFCSRFLRQTFPKINDEYIKTGKLRYIFRDFPLEAIHPNAFKAAEAAHCSGDQGKYWEMHDLLFANQKALSVEDFVQHAQTLALDLPLFEKCLEVGKHSTLIRQDLAEGSKAGVRGTPIFFLGITESNGKTMKPLQIIRGAQPYAKFQEAFERLLNAEKEPAVEKAP